MSASLFPHARHNKGVSPAQRFSPRRPCPICAGHALMEPGAGRRCFGFFSADGEWAHCTREEHAAQLKLEAAANTYAHKLKGACACGQQHGAAEPEREVTAHRFAKHRHPIDETYAYFDAHGQLRFQVCRTHAPKKFVQRRPDRNGGWIWNMAGVEPVLYRLPKVVATPLDQPIYIVEGEKCVHALEGLGVVATTNPGGATRWRDIYNSALVGRRVVVLADNDGIGRKHAANVAGRLKAVAAEVVTLDLPDLPPKGDVVEWIAAGGNRDELERLVAVAREAQRPRGPEVLVRLSEVEREELVWVWPGYLPLSKLVMVDGDPGLGKSTVTLDWIARITRGLPFPGGAGLGRPYGAVLLTLEDGLGDTIRPRLEAAGADLDRVVALRGVMKKGVEQIPSLPDDMASIRAAVQAVDAKIVVIDPVVAYLGGGVDAHRDQDVRRALTPLAQLANELHVVIPLVRHLNKAQGGPSIYRGGGSMGLIGAVRLGLVVARDPDDARCRVLAIVKSNLAVEAPSLRYRLESTPLGVAKVGWLGESPYDANQILSGEVEKPTATNAAKRFVQDLLAGGPRRSSEVISLGEAASHSQRTIERAAEELGVIKARIGFGGNGFNQWSLPAEDRPAGVEEGVL